MLLGLAKAARVLRAATLQSTARYIRSDRAHFWLGFNTAFWLTAGVLEVLYAR